MSNSVARFVPGFRTSCLIVGVLEVILAASILARGVPASMLPFGVPEEIAQSPHYEDAILWVYWHQLVLGLLIGLLGLTVREPRAQLAIARFLIGAHALFAFLDFRSSDSALGNALYRGDASLVPAIVCVAMALVFIPPSFASRTT